MPKPFIKAKRSSAPVWALPTNRLPADAWSADGVFETLRLYHRRIAACEQHAARLIASARAAGITLRESSAQICRRMAAAARRSPWPEAYLRIAVVPRPAAHHRYRLQMVTRRFGGYHASQHRRGVVVRTVPLKRFSVTTVSPMIKSSNGLPGVQARSQDARRQAFELLGVTAQGLVTEGTVSNLWIVSGRTLMTPPAWVGVLRGVTSGMVQRAARRLGYQVVEWPLTRYDVWAADEVFLTNTLMEVMPVRVVDGRRIGAGRSGPVTRQVRRVFRAEVEALLDGDAAD